MMRMTRKTPLCICLFPNVMLALFVVEVGLLLTMKVSLVQKILRILQVVVFGIVLRKRTKCVLDSNTVVQKYSECAGVRTMTSISPSRTFPYSNDLCWRMIWQKLGLGLSIKTVARSLCVNPSTVSRIVANFDTTGDVMKRPYPKNARPYKKIDKPCPAHNITYSAPFLHELQKAVCVLTRVYLSVPSLCTFLKKYNFTPQKMQLASSMMMIFEHNSQ